MTRKDDRGHRWTDLGVQRAVIRIVRRLSPGFGLNDTSHQFLLRWGVSREFTGFGEVVRRLFGASR